MKGLSGARVVVVDDNEKEALPILKELAKRGIPAAYYNGAKRSLPSKKARLQGVRLAFLDMDLIGGGANDAGMASALVTFLKNLFHPDNGPYGVVAWTNRPEVVSLFENYLHKDGATPKPVFTIRLPKAACKRKTGEFNLSIVSRELGTALQSASPLMFLVDWEAQSIKSAGDVTNKLSHLASPTASPDLSAWRTAWIDQMLKLMHRLAEADAEQHLDPKTCLPALHASLQPLLADQMERSADFPSKVAQERSHSIVAAKGAFDAFQLARLNTMLHLAPGNSTPRAPGNIYGLATKRRPKWAPSKKEIIRDLMRKVPSNPDPEKQKENELSRIDEIDRMSVAIVVDGSAACDHAQRKIRLARLIPGLIIPSDKVSTLINSKAEYWWALNSLEIANPAIPPNTAVSLILDARYTTGVDLQYLAKAKVLGRIRSEALHDLQAWYARFVTRSGVMLLA